MGKSNRSWQLHILIILVYLLLALLLTWPLLKDFASHVPGNGVDDPPLTWNLWWVRYALLDIGTNPFESDYLFYPLGINLAFYTLTLLNGLLSIPLQAVFGLVPASNLLLLSSFVLSGYGGFLLGLHVLASCRTRVDGVGAKQAASLPVPKVTGSRRLSGSRLAGSGIQFAAFAVGLLYAFSSSKLAYAALGQWNIASSQWIPFYVLYLFKITEHPRQRRYLLMAALFMLFQAYAELTYATFLVLFTGLWLVFQAVARLGGGSFVQLGRLLANLMVLGLVVVLGMLPVLAMMIPDLRVEGDIFAEGSGFADVFSADLLGFLVPTMYHPVLGSLVERFAFDHSVGQHIFVGLLAFGLAALGGAYWWRRHVCHVEGDASRRALRLAEGASEFSSETLHPCFLWVRFWSVSTLLFWLMAMGPTLRINGHDTGLPLPFSLVAQLPFFKGNRYPSRYSVLFVLSLAILAGTGLLVILRGLRQRSKASSRFAGVLLVVLLLAGHLSTPLPLSDMSVPEVYQFVADEMPGAYTLLDLPVAWRNGARVMGTQHPIIMFEQYYQAVHGKRILAGNTSRNPPLKFQYFAEAPLINTLIALETGHAVDGDVVEQDRDLASEVLRFFNIRAIIVHPEQTGPGMLPYIETVMPVQAVYEDGEVVAYSVRLPPGPDAWRIEPGDKLGRLSFAEGWGLPAYGSIWAQRRAVRLLVPLEGNAQRMAFRAYVPEAGQRLAVEVNGQPVEQLDMTVGWMEYDLTISSEKVRPGLNEIWLRFEELYPASHVRLSPRAIGRTGVDSPVNLAVQSAGQEVGDFGHIYVNGQDASADERGYNVVVLHPESGEIEGVGAFDTHIDSEASQTLAAFLSEVPRGHIVAVSAADEASRLLNQEAVTALQGIGAQGDLREKTRWGHAIIGVQGAQPGTALEALDWMRPTFVAAGEGATEPALAAAFSEIVLTAEAGWQE